MTHRRPRHLSETPQRPADTAPVNVYAVSETVEERDGSPKLYRCVVEVRSRGSVLERHETAWLPLEDFSAQWATTRSHSKNRLRVMMGG